MSKYFIDPSTLNIAKRKEFVENNFYEFVSAKEYIKKLQEQIKWMRENMDFLEYPYEESEYEFCKICGKPEWKHKKDCQGIIHLKIIDELLKDI